MDVVWLRKPWRTKTTRLVLVLGMVVFLAFHTFTLTSRNSELHEQGEMDIQSKFVTSSFMEIGKFSFPSDTRNSKLILVAARHNLSTEVSTLRGKLNTTVKDDGLDRSSGDTAVDVGLDKLNVGEVDMKEEVSLHRGVGTALKKVMDPMGGFIKHEKYIKPIESVEEPQNSSYHVADEVNEVEFTTVIQETKMIDSNSHDPPNDPMPVVSPLDGQEKKALSLSMQHTTIPKTETAVVLLNWTSITSTKDSNTPAVRKKKRLPPPLSISEMERLLVRNHASYHAMKPQWSSAHDEQMFATKAHIQSAQTPKRHPQLYAPAFRNISMFTKSYELMERTLKIYAYKEGKKPIFHQPILSGIYASEGWFMKLMEENKHFLVKDPRKAHLFYMPFSSRLLREALCSPSDHNRAKLRPFLENYVDIISSKYPFWNRTGGADHFLVACHDWSAYATRHVMGKCIRALCNADLHDGFKLGKDVSLPETYVRYAANPLKGLGGRPANKRPILAFFAGSMHGRLRPKLLRHWENKDPVMKILGPMPQVRNNITYVLFMKRSKYCICPRGHEVNSPRLVESIFYECVPVIISDNYVPPFFEFLNWEELAVIIKEKDVQRLKEILLSIPEKKYQKLLLGIRKVQHHFLWHNKPVRYDLFHMILHNIWFNRVYQMRAWR